VNSFAGQKSISKKLIDKKSIDRAVTRISHEILEKNDGAESLVIIGILTRGADIAKRIASRIKEIERVEVQVGLMDINLYRDDVHHKLDHIVTMFIISSISRLFSEPRFSLTLSTVI